MQYAYDESGVLFNFLLLALLALHLTLLVFMWLTSGPKTVKLTSNSDLPHYAAKSSFLAKTKRPSNVFSFRFMLLVLGWTVFALITYRAATHQSEDATRWDPYQILGVSESADEAVIKKAFKKLSLKFHPDKVAEADRGEAEKKFVDISKAYKTLTDPETRKVFDETGHPDGKQGKSGANAIIRRISPFQLGLALPKWLVEEGNNRIASADLTALIRICVARWWSTAKHMTRNKVANETMALFYREIKDQMGFKPLLEILSRSFEFRELATRGSNSAYDELAEQVRVAMENKTHDRFDKTKKLQGHAKDPVSVAAFRAQLLITAHMLRVKPKNAALQEEMIKVVEICALLVIGMLQIATARFWLLSSLSIIDLSQHIIQAYYYRQSPILQLPYVDVDDLKQFQTKKRNVSTVQQFIQLSKDDQRSLLSHLNDEQFDAVTAAAARIPAVKIVKAEYTVAGETLIAPGSIVTLAVKMRAVYNNREPEGRNDHIEDAEEAGKKKQWWVDKNEVIQEPHSPHFFAVKKPTWWVILANEKDNRVICVGKVIGLDEDKTVRLQFQAPPNPGSWTFQVFVKSDTFAGTDNKIDLKATLANGHLTLICVDPRCRCLQLVVKPEEAVEDDDEEEDDDDEEEENPFAPPKPPVKRRRTLPASERQHYDDSTDTEDDEDGPNNDGGWESESSQDSDFVE
ncbi:secretory subunit [Polyrhizophydium stewartii]|uniref:Secretory subunit n=1 Tax=Polyrhizophydium stewartii TaxID=2732419 RepID=A0ABR4MZ87_9FUNG